MKKIFICATILVFCFTRNFAVDIKKVLAEKLNNSVKKISFKYNAAPLVKVINDIASIKGVNIVFPVGEAAIKQKLTISIDEKLSLGEAWTFLQTILDVAGYSMFPQGESSFTIVKAKGNENISREPFPILISTPYDDIPNSDKRITYLMYFSNIHIPKEGSDQGVVSKILSGDAGLLAKGSKFKIIPDANGVMIAGRSNNIRSIVRILTELDKVGFKEEIEIINLQYASAGLVEQMVNTKLFESQQKNRYRLRSRKKSEVQYFESGTKVIAEPRTNSLILVGRNKAIYRLKNFIVKHVDIPIGSGRSILHRKVLQYLDADKFVEDLRNIVGAAGQEDAQSRPGSSAAYGPERFFQGVIVEQDKPPLPEGEDEEKGRYKYSGTNSLIIAANNDDWIRIKKLIEELDKPQPQIIIEVLIVDLTIDENKVLGTSLRNPSGLPMPLFGNQGQSLNVQSGQVGLSSQTNVIVTDPMLDKGCPVTPNTTIAGDLMIGQGTDNPYISSVNTDAGDRGSTLVSLSDKNGDVWSILKVLSSYGHLKILSHPYVVAINNQPSEVKVGEQRIVAGAGGQGSGSTVVQETDPINADLTVGIVPKIGASNTVNLAVDIHIDEFKYPNQLVVASSEEDQATIAGDRFNRKIKTNANVRSGDILALGGLIKVDVLQSTRATPILGSIPILGWLFKRKSSERKKVNLTVFIRPTIVQPQLRAGMNKYTKDYIRVAKAYVDEGMLFDTLRDPVTRWFFKTDVDAKEVMDIFTEEVGEVKRDVEYQKKAETLGELVHEDDLNMVDNKTQKDKEAKASKNFTDIPEYKEEKIEVTENKQGTVSRNEKLKGLLKNERNPLLRAVTS